MFLNYQTYFLVKNFIMDSLKVKNDRLALTSY